MKVHIAIEIEQADTEDEARFERLTQVLSQIRDLGALVKEASTVTVSGPGPTHGISGYNHGCRCPVCTEASRSYGLGYRAGGKRERHEQEGMPV